MVNQDAANSTRARILATLRNFPQALSGEKIAALLGVSRVAVWKAIQTLNASGYRIISSSHGYTLVQDIGDSLFPWEFGSAEERIRHWDDTDSTMNRAREAALSGAADGLVLIAEHQSDGRGTGSKKWESTPGGLFFTMITRPSLNQAYFHRQVLTAQCAMIRAIRSTTKLKAYAAWPNDILVSDSDQPSETNGKAGGILCETLCSGNTTHFLNLGIGINTGDHPVLSGTASVPMGRKELLTRFIHEFEQLQPLSEDLIPLWQALSNDPGKNVSWRNSPDGPVSSDVFTGLDQAGWAIIGQNHFPPGTISILNKGSNS